MCIEASHNNFLTSTLLWMFITMKKYVEVFSLKLWLLYKKKKKRKKEKVISNCDMVLIQGNLHGWRGNLFAKGNIIAHVSVHAWEDNINLVCPMLNHICVRLGPTPPTPPSRPGLPARTYMGTLGNDESDVNLNICNFGRVLSHWFPTRKGSQLLTHVWAWRPDNERDVGGPGLSRTQMWFSLGCLELLSLKETRLN